MHNCQVLARMLRISPLLLTLAVAPLLAATEGGAIAGPMPLFPPDNWWNTDISSAPVDPNSARYIAFIRHRRAAQGMHPDFGGDSGDPSAPIYGMPYIVVSGSQPLSCGYIPLCRRERRRRPPRGGVPGYPIPDEAKTQRKWIEGGLAGNDRRARDGDRHMLIVDRDNRILFELYATTGTLRPRVGRPARAPSFRSTRTRGGPTAGPAPTPPGWRFFPDSCATTRSTAPIQIRHAFRVTVRASRTATCFRRRTTRDRHPRLFRWERGFGSRRPKTSRSSLSLCERSFSAMKTYGLIVADNGSDMYVTGTYDTRWDNDLLNPAFAAIKASDFEVVQLGWQASTSFVLSVPAVTGSGDAATATLTAYDTSNSVAAGYRGTVHFTSSDGSATLPVDYTFTATDAGAHTFTGGITLRTPGGQTVTATDTASATITNTRNTVVGPATPAALAATAASASQVNLTWNPSAGAVQYEVQRMSAGSAYATIATPGSASHADMTVSAGATYVYRVRAIDSASRPSPYSVPDAATTIFFTDDPLVAGATTVKAVHINELRSAVNAMRSAAGLATSTFTNSVSAGVVVRAIDLMELRTAVDQARSTLGLPAVTYTDATAVAGSTIVKAVHLQQLRVALQ